MVNAVLAECEVVLLAWLARHSLCGHAKEWKSATEAKPQPQNSPEAIQLATSLAATSPFLPLSVDMSFNRDLSRKDIWLFSIPDVTEPAYVQGWAREN